MEIQKDFKELLELFNANKRTLVRKKDLTDLDVLCQEQYGVQVSEDIKVAHSSLYTRGNGDVCAKEDDAPLKF